MIKAILLDIDGTLTNSRKEITPKTKEALLKAQAAGIRLAVVSARTENGLARFGRWLDFENNHGVLIACNGALIKDMETGEVFFDKSMSKELGAAILEHLKKFKVIPLVAKGQYMYTNDVFSGMIKLRGKDGSCQEVNIIQYESRSNEYLLCEEKDLADFFKDTKISKILVAGDSDYLSEHAEEMAAPFKDSTANGFTASCYYEFNPKGVDKAEAIHTAFGSLGISADEMMAFGDQRNDISMLKAVKYGIAMGNAVDEAKEAAFDVTNDNDHDGIAESIYKYIPQLSD